MQNRYTGDIGDFCKYGLIRFLFLAELGGLNMKLGVNWYLVPNETHNQDGKYITYLNDAITKNVEEYKVCDPYLYNKLQAIVRENRRTVDRVEEREILPESTEYFRKKLSFEKTQNHNRLSKRLAWERK